jgi:putative two-component system response regulator
MSAPAILVVDDDEGLRETLSDALASLGFAVLGAPSAEAALALVDRRPPDLVLTDVHMPGVSGVELCRRLKADPRFELLPVVVMTAVSDLDSRVEALEAGADDFFAKPFEFVELRTRVAALLRLRLLLVQLERAENVITALGLAIEARDPYTAHHCERLSRFSAALGQALGVDADTLRALRLGAYLHDLGKITVPDAVLLKPGPLDPEERRRIQQHSAAGAGLLAGMKSLDTARPIVRHHHERLDGSGYPDGLAGEAIPLAARIMSAVDVYDALRTARPYKASMSRDRALGIFQDEAGKGWWDGRVTETLVRLAPDLDAMSGNGHG